ncbi:transposase IS66 family protein, partial [Escherichia coli 8.2524]
RRSPEANQ